MSLISQIRSLIQDQPLFQTDITTTVSGQLTLQTKYFPVVDESVIITPPSGSAPDFTLTDPQNGRITLDAPGALAGDYRLEYNQVILLDSTIQDFIDVNTDSTGLIADARIIAADCLDAMATQMILVLKKIKILDLQTDGPAMAKEMRAAAKNMRDLVLTEDVFDIVEMVYDRPSWLEMVYKNFERSGE
jgi:hypothetical protein